MLLNEPFGVAALGITEEREIDLSFYTLQILLELVQEYREDISPTKICIAVRSSPYLETEPERTYLAAMLSRICAEGRALRMIATEMKIRALVPGWTVEQRLERHRAMCRDMLGASR